MATVIIGGLIILYAVWVLVRRHRDRKAGKMCSCGCGGCASGCRERRSQGGQEDGAGK